MRINLQFQDADCTIAIGNESNAEIGYLDQLKIIK